MTSEYERRAEEILSKLLGGQVTPRDVRDAPPGTHDFDVVLPNGTTIAVEVTSVTDPGAEAFWKAVAEESWDAATLSKSWVLDVESGAKVKTLKHQVEDALRELEAEGRKQFGKGLDADVPEKLWRLGVRRGDAFDWSSPCIFVTSVGKMIWSDVEDLRCGVEGVAWAEDNRRKLSRAKADERHLFVWVSLLNSRVAAAFLGMNIKPPSACCLPQEIDVIWVAQPTLTDKGRILCEELWRFDRRGGWRRVR